MDEENRKNGNDSETGRPQRTPRVRSRTVLLTSDMAGQVRSRLSAGAARDGGFGNTGIEEEPQTNSAFERVGRQETMTGFERRGEVTTVTARPNFQPRPTVTETQQNEEEEEIPSHLTRQRMEEAEREITSTSEWHPKTEAREEPTPEAYAMPERSIADHYSKPEHSIAEQSYEPRAAIRAEQGGRTAPQREFSQRDTYQEEVNSEEDRIVWSKEGALVGFLISYDKNENGSFYELRTGRLIVTSEFTGTGNFLYLNDQTVSPMHAILRCSKGSPIQVLDQLSECGTKIVAKEDKSTKELAGDKGSLKQGDTVFFGERSFKVCLVED